MENTTDESETHCIPKLLLVLLLLVLALLVLLGRVGDVLALGMGGLD